ncbi:MFS general substrate transporter [Mycena latifolia]|nr:MFS general substrate transporter [Mycena latifolia]
MAEPDKTDAFDSSLREISMDQGGKRAWMTIVGGFLVAAVTFGYTFSFGVYQDVYTRSHAASPSSISWIGSTQLFFLLVMGLPAGKLLDMGYFRHTVLAGSFVLVSSMFMVSIAHPDRFYQIYLAQGLCMGLGAGMLYVPALAVQAHYWRDRRAVAMGIVVSGTSVGGIIFPIMLNNLFKDSAFGWGVRDSTFLTLGILVFANLFIKDKPAVRAANRAKSNIRGILTDVPYMLCVLGDFIVVLGILFPYFYLQLFAMERGIDQNLAFYSLAILNAAALPGRLLPNILADRIGPYNVFIPCTAACSVLIFSMLAIQTPAGIIVFAVLFGFFSGAFLSLFGPCIAIITENPHDIGLRFGFAYFVTGFSALTGPPICGALLGASSTGVWSRPIIFSGVTNLVGVGFYVATRQMLVKLRGKQFV